jgi:hypothetical protein
MTEGVTNETSKELAKLLYHKIMSNMKYALDLEEYSYKDQGRNDPRFRFFKKQLMANTYDMLRSVFKDLNVLGLIDKTDYEEDVKDGYKESASGGSGYLNTAKFNKWLGK